MTALSGEPGGAPRPDDAAPQQPSDDGARAGQRASLTFLGLLLCSAVFAVGYRLLMRNNLGQGAALFIGLPVILGAVIAMATTPRSALGMTLKVTALCMCVIAPLLGVTWFARQNHFEWMFNPLPNAAYANVADAVSALTNLGYSSAQASAAGVVASMLAAFQPWPGTPSASGISAGGEAWKRAMRPANVRRSNREDSGPITAALKP